MPAFLKSILSFTRLPTSLLLTVVYAAVFIAVLVSDSLPEIPNDTLGLDVNEAYASLHQIAAQPHPVNSHANDVVRTYILDRLKSISNGFPHVEVADDLTSNATWLAAAGQGVSFEGSNILVKVQGTEPNFSNQGGVLFSAHFDSVSTAPGVTDDGMAVAALIEFVRYLTTNRTKRTAIFNINNGEEDGLKGAYVFFQHPWSSIPDTFLNLEGAAAGGRPILFRATSTAPVLSFTSTNVLHPHGNVLSADAFSRRVIRSRTDYSVYELGLGNGSKGMEGIDFAFYQGRSKYHTKYDSIPGVKGGKRSLWAMMESVRGAGLALLDQDDTHVGAGQPDPPVYFDLFGQVFVVFTQQSLLIFNVAMLVLGPITILVLHYIASGQNDVLRSSSHTHATQVSFWRSDVWRWAKFWVALVLGLLLQIILVSTFININPFVVYSQPFTVLASTLTLAYLSTVFTLQFPFGEDMERFAEQQKLTMLLQTYVFSWILLAIGTIALNSLAIGGVYFLTGWNIFVFLGCAVASTERIMKENKISSRPAGEDHEEEEDGGSNEPHPLNPLPPTERTPLLAPTSLKNLPCFEEDGSQGWWIAELLLAVPVPVILLSHILLLLIQALNQTLSDGNSPVVVYGAMSLLSFLIVLPLTPFSFKIHHWISSVVLLIFVISMLYNWTAFPFSQEDPLKVFFQQKIAIDVSGPSNEVLQSITTLTGATRYIEKMVVSELPSSWSSSVKCVPSHGTLSTCSWETSLFPSPINLDCVDPAPPQWLSVNTTRTSSTSALISLKGTNTRSCRIYFDNHNIKTFNVHEITADGRTVPSSPSIVQKVYPIPPEGLSSLALWSRTWDRTFTVQVSWDETETDSAAGAGLSGRVACEWAQYESATMGLPRNLTGTIPAFEEVLMYLPKWAVASKVDDGLVEVFGNFSI